MARRSRYALSAAVAGACLTLCACGVASAPAATGSRSVPTQAGSGGSSSKFCGNATSFLAHIPAAPSGKHVSQAKQRAGLRKVLQDTITGFSSLESEAPAQLHAPLKKVVRVYRSDQKALQHTTSMAKISEAIVKGYASGTMAFQEVLKYIGTDCAR